MLTRQCDVLSNSPQWRGVLTTLPQVDTNHPTPCPPLVWGAWRGGGGEGGGRSGAKTGHRRGRWDELAT